MAGTIEGGKRAAATNLAKNPNFYRDIGKIGGRNGHGGGFASGIMCECNLISGKHHNAQCRGKLGGIKSRRTKKS